LKSMKVNSAPFLPTTIIRFEHRWTTLVSFGD
jgi:hypothetical protein